MNLEDLKVLIHIQMVKRALDWFLKLSFGTSIYTETVEQNLKMKLALPFDLTLQTETLLILISIKTISYIFGIDLDLETTT